MAAPEQVGLGRLIVVGLSEVEVVVEPGGVTFGAQRKGLPVSDSGGSDSLVSGEMVWEGAASVYWGSPLRR